MRILRFPVAVAHFMWRFLIPEREVGRVPLGRLVIAAQLFGALFFLGYTLVKKEIRLPFSGSPYKVHVIFPDAKGLDPSKQPVADVAGTPLGRVTSVQYSQGRALVTLSLDPSVKGKIFADASATLRPLSALQNHAVNIDPGTPSAGPLSTDRPIPPERTSSFVAIDELTSVLDADTQAYVQILITEAEQGLHGRSTQLRRSLQKLGTLTDDAIPVSRALADRRRLLTRLVGDLNVIFRTTGERQNQLAQVVDSGSRTLAVTAAREIELAQTTRELGPTLVQTQRALAAVRRLAVPLVPALDRLIPAAPPLGSAFRSFRALLPRANHFVGITDAVTRQARRPLRLLVAGTTGLTGRVHRLIPLVAQLTDLAGLLNHFKVGMAEFGDNWSGALSVNDNGGVYGQVDVLKAEPARPENFGYARHSKVARKQLNHDLAAALERTCWTENAWACVARLRIPGLPKHAVTKPPAGLGRAGRLGAGHGGSAGAGKGG